MATKLKARKTPLPTPEEARAHYEFLDSVVRAPRPEGFQLDELESALGMYVIGHHFGWKVLYMVHTKRTIRKYEEILGRKVVDMFPEVGPDADRTNAYRVIEAASNFWKAVSGEDKPLGAVDRRALVR